MWHYGWLCVRYDSEIGEVRCSRLLCCLDEFIRRRCHLECQTSSLTVTVTVTSRQSMFTLWPPRQTSSLTVSACLYAVDRDLLTSGWQETSLINDTTTIFVFSLLSRCIDDFVAEDEDSSADQLRTLIHVCLYLCYSYAGCEISYPLRPFIRGCYKVLLQPRAVTCRNHHNDYHDYDYDNYADDDDDDDDDDDEDEDIVINHTCPTHTDHSWSSTASSSDSDDVPDDCRRRFWTCCMSLVQQYSWLMLRLHSDSELYARVYRQLTFYCPTSHCTAVHSLVPREPWPHDHDTLLLCFASLR